MDKIYLSGAIEQANNPSRWREDIQEAVSYGNVEYLDPIDKDVEESLSMLRDSDAVLVHYNHDTPSYRVPMEVLIASRTDRPVMVWTDRYNGLVENTDPFLQYFADEFQQNGRESVNRLLSLI